MTDVKNLQFHTDGAPEGVLPSVEEVVESFKNRAPELLRDSDVAQVGTVRVNTTRGASLFSKEVLEALRIATENRDNARVAAAERAERAEERRDDQQRMIDLRPYRQILRHPLSQTRRHRREIARAAARSRVRAAMVL